MSLHVSPIRFEHHREALGIGESAPRLSWVTDTAPTGWSQAAYELELRTDGAESETARVESSESVLVEWPFGPLLSRKSAQVRVRVEGADGVSAWNEWATVEAGLLDASDWVARVVGPDPSTGVGVDAPSLVRSEFHVEAKAVTRARLYASAHGVVELELNGERVGRDELTPGWTAYESRLRYATYDVTELLKVGPNAIGAWLGDGWWRGRLGWDGARALYGSDLGVLAQLEVDYADGSRQVVASSTEWVAAPSPVLTSDLYDGESYDAERFDAGWSTADFDATGWVVTVELDRALATLVAPDGPPVRHVESLPVQEALHSPSGKLIVDFGQNLVGRLSITVNGGPGQTITLRHAEVLEHGELATGPLRTAKATDTYVLAGRGEETWAPRFTFHGFRYAEITGWPGDFDPTHVHAEVLHSDMERTGWFTASDPLVERLHENVVWGMRGNFLDLPTDCPQRDERLGWTGDLQVFAPTASFLYDSSGFLESWLRDLAAEQTRLGGVPMVVPAVTSGASAPMAGWADAATIVPWVLYDRYQDLGVLARQFDSMAAWVDQVQELAGDSHLWTSGHQFGDWLDPLAPAGRPEAALTNPDIVATAYFARSAQIVSDAARLVGRNDEAERYAELASEVRRAFHDEYVTASGRLLSDSTTAYSLAIQFDLLDQGAQRQNAGDRLADLVRDNRYKISTGFIGTPIISDALTATGHVDVAYRLLLQTDNPSWLYSVKQGATTIWERWDSLLPDGTVNPSGMTSFNHYAFGSVADWLHRVVAGLAPAEPGYRSLRIAPRPPRQGLTSASAELRTPYGLAASAWSIEDGSLTVRATVPVGTSASVALPSGASFEVGHGEHWWSEPFEVESAASRVFTVDSTLAEIAESDEAMGVLTGVITKYVPEAAAAMSSGLSGQGQLTPRAIAPMLPRAEEVLADLARGFEAVSAGLEIPSDVLAFAESDTPDDLEEKAALLSGQDFWSTRAGDGIRSIVMVDGPHGVRRQEGTADNLGFNESLPSTCFPPGTALGSSWDRGLFREVGEALGREARGLGVDVLLGPAINIKRSPLNGRNFEYLAEDPYLTGVLAAEYVRGVQSTGVGATLKHFAVNSQETERMRVSADVDARALREIYLPAFERVVRDAQPATVMSAYNAINGVFSSENAWLLTELLRDEWGFDGLVVSDWGAVKDRVEALRAGLDLDMPGTNGEATSAIVAAVREGKLDRRLVERSVERLRRLDEQTRSQETIVGFDEDAHHAVARRAAAASIVLLRNEGAVLPLPHGARVAVIGEFAAAPRFQGGGSSHVNPTRVDVPLEQLKLALGGENVTFASGYGSGADIDSLLSEARSIAQAADIAVVFVGLDEASESEGFDRTDIDLPAAHLAVIDAVASVARKTVVVLSNGGVVNLEPWHDRVDAIVEGWALGQAVGSAITDVLTGAVNPSGRLAETIPLALSDTPSYLNFPGENLHVRYGEGVFVGYRYYETSERPVRYPFGHGLSYTSFDYEDLRVEIVGDDSARVNVRVRNTGSVAGAHVVQLYVAPADSAVRRPVRELAAFDKVYLEPGERVDVVFELDSRSFAFWDESGSRWWVQPGRYEVEIGLSAHDILQSATLDLVGYVDRPAPLDLDSTVGEWFGHPVVGPLLMQGMMANATEEQRAAAGDNAANLKMVESMPMGQFARFPGVDIPAEMLEQLVALSTAEPALVE